MAQKNHTTNLTELLLQCVAQPDPMLSMLEWLCSQLMEAEVSQQLGAEKSERAESRSGYRCGYRPRRLDRHANLKYKYGSRNFWCRGYFVDTVGKNAKMIQEYIQNQLEEDLASDQISLKEYMDPFTGSKRK